MPAISFASIDMVDDSIDFNKFNQATPVKSNNAFVTTTPVAPPAKHTLILAPPSVAAHEEKLYALFSTYDRSTSDLQMLDRLAAGFVTLSPNSYDLVLVLTDADGAQRSEALQLLSRKVFAALVPAMKTGGQLRFQDGSRLQDGATVQREAILAGLVEKDGIFEKAEEEEVVVPLRLKKKAAPKPSTNGTVALNGNGIAKVPVAPKPVSKKRPAVTIDLGEYSDGDELVDEDTLLTAEERNRPPQQPPSCTVDGKKRRKPCKDCTCGLAERMEEEDRTRRSNADRDLRNVFKLASEELNELDFTVKGKTGSCNSCSLGDAFRCSTCPYIGLPPFKPGEEVKILNGLVQL